ncbi:MAG: histidine kinase [Clostridium sp.]|uniref:LytS/YhcK type 5TM receptor domain-containing protein n=1 Tax=Clostridium sp. TaxID=1506 RepID=UPI0025BC29A9|nr:LytS/YhcK type 5TM receptor domain-containing protein [Clostridium sp.]MCF0148442.1 histidine kinase [Clostridium sp.]
MNIEIIKSIILSIGLLLVIAQILARFNKIKGYLVSERHTIKDQLVMIIIFSTISILSTYMGYEVRGALANTRVIGVMAGGFIGGPIVGIATAIIAGVHRYAIDINGFAAIACCISTILEGVIAAFSSNYVKRQKYKEINLYLITFIAEIFQMIVILIISKPFDMALELVKSIAFPMVFINSFGLVLFVGVFKHIFIEQQYELGEKMSLAFDITKLCLPVIEKGEYNERSCEEIGKIIFKFSKKLGIVFTDNERIIYTKGKLSIDNKWHLPKIAKKVLEEKTVCLEEESEEGDSFYKALKNAVAIGAPLIKNGQAFGCFIIFTDKYKLSLEPEIKFAEGLSSFLSTKYELLEAEKQRDLMQKAEFHALQSQINPHFIFNSLNTISAFCREKPGKARELLIDLATYFRNAIQNKEGLVDIHEEIDYVKAYLQLEKARFEERLSIDIKMQENLKCKLPCLILQPIVENAVIHGAMKRKQGIVNIIIKEEDRNLKISVIDNGFGIPMNIIKGLNEKVSYEGNIGLINVHRRLCYLYGKDHGLDIVTSNEGTKINIYIPMRGKGAVNHEGCNN